MTPYPMVASGAGGAAPPFYLWPSFDSTVAGWTPTPAWDRLDQLDNLTPVSYDASALVCPLPGTNLLTVGLLASPIPLTSATHRLFFEASVTYRLLAGTTVAPLAGFRLSGAGSYNSPINQVVPQNVFATIELEIPAATVDAWGWTNTFNTVSYLPKGCTNGGTGTIFMDIGWLGIRVETL